MKNVMLIKAEAVRESGYVHKNVLPDVISTTIMRVQQTMLKKVMGKIIYNAFLDKVSNSLPPSDPIVPLSSDDVELLGDYIQPYLVACVDYRIIYPLTLRARSKSVGKGQDENHAPADMVELIRLKDQMKQDVDAYREDLVDKLLDIENSCMPNGIDLRTGHRTGHARPTTPWNGIKFR
jgi:hypothetical protein